MKKIHYILISAITVILAGLSFSSFVSADTIGSLSPFYVNATGTIVSRYATNTNISNLTVSGTCTGCAESAGAAWLLLNGGIYNATSTDSVLVGTSTPTTAQFFIQGSGTKNPLTVASSTGSSLLTVLANGNVGIGTAAPGAKLHVVGSGTALYIDSGAS